MRTERRAHIAIAILGVAVVIAVVAFMTLGVRSNWEFVLAFRARKLLGLILVAHAIACSTVLFQTVTANRILTPSIMGFDALFVLSSTLMVAVLGSVSTAQLDARGVFAVNVVLMVAASMALYRWLFLGGESSLHRLLLIGVVFGIFMRTLAQLVQRMLDPNEFMVLTDMLFASFGNIDPLLMGFGWMLVVPVTVWAGLNHNRLDVIALGRPLAVNLGLSWRRDVLMVLSAISVMVAVSTALVGPVTFFGLLAASLAHVITGTARHRYLLPAATLAAVLLLIGGQVILERVLGFDTALSIVVEFVGGVVFILLLLRRSGR